MKRILRFWPIYVAVSTLVITVCACIRSWEKCDVFVFQADQNDNLSITAFALCTSVRMKISFSTHAFSFGGVSVPSSTGYHQVEASQLLKEKNSLFGKFHFKPNPAEAWKERKLFIGAPTWLICSVGYIPLLMWWWKRRTNRVGSSNEPC